MTFECDEAGCGLIFRGWLLWLWAHALSQGRILPMAFGALFQGSPTISPRSWVHWPNVKQTSSRRPSRQISHRAPSIMSRTSLLGLAHWISRWHRLRCYLGSSRVLTSVYVTACELRSFLVRFRLSARAANCRHKDLHSCLLANRATSYGLVPVLDT